MFADRWLSWAGHPHHSRSSAVKVEGHGGISNRQKQLILNGTSVNIDPDTQKGRTWLEIFAAPGPLNSHWISLRVFCFTLFYPAYMHLISHLGMVQQIQHITHDFMGVNKSFFSKVVTGIDHATDMMYHIRYIWRHILYIHKR